MPTAVAVVADDLTGAADTGGGFAAAGLSTTVTWSRFVLDGRLLGHQEVLAVDMETRAGAPSRARDTTERVVRWVRERDVRTIYKKCDSTLRGHIGEEVAAARAAWRPSSVVVAAFAFPAAGRTTIEGRQYVRGVPLDRPPIASILDGAGLVTRHANLDIVRATGLDDWVRRCSEDGATAVVCDAATDDDLAAIARAGISLGPRVVWVGSGGLARALPSTLRIEHGDRVADRDWRFARGPILIVVGSRTAIARAQAARMVSAGAAHVAVPIDVLVSDGGAESSRGIAENVERYLRRGRDVVVTIGQIEDVDVLERPVATRLGELLRPAASIAGGVIVTGGDTATAVLRSLDATALRLIEEIEPGVPLGVAVAPRAMPVVTKAGAFGDSDTLVRAAARMRQLSV
jgi:uncharacterized protein YgbK (DUF1537 family)